MREARRVAGRNRSICACSFVLRNRSHYGPKSRESLTFREATAILGAASGRPLRFVSLSFPELGAALSRDFPPPVVEFFLDLFGFLLDGHNAQTTDGVSQMLGRPPRRLADLVALEEAA